MRISTGSIPLTGVPFSQAEYDRRYAGVLDRFESAGIDALCVTANTHLQYLTGYNGRGTYFGPYPLIVAPGKTPTMVVRTYDEDAVRTESWIEEVVPYRQRREMAKTWAGVLRRLGLERARIGLELDSWNLAPADVLALQAELPGITVVDATKVVPSVAFVKSDVEIEAMRRSMALTKIAVRAFNESIREGVSELEVWDKMVRAVIAAGGGFAASTSLGFGRRTAIPHGAPADHRIERDQPAFTEVAGVAAGYEAGLCRTAILGRHAGAESLFAVAAESLQAGIDAIRPGATMGDVDAACRRVIDAAGRGDIFRHRAGYQNGIGWSYRGDASLEPAYPDVLKPGVTVHLPIILFEQGEFCVGCSESVLVTETGAEVLSGGTEGIFFA